MLCSIFLLACLFILFICGIFAQLRKTNSIILFVELDFSGACVGLFILYFFESLHCSLIQLITLFKLRILFVQGLFFFTPSTDDIKYEYTH